MKPDRLNAFTDGVIAIIITIMVLEIRLPHEPSSRGSPADAAAPRRLPARLHLRRHLLEQPPSHDAAGAARSTGGCCGQTYSCCSGSACSRSMIRWIGEARRHAWPVAAFGVRAVMSAVAYLLLERALIAAEGEARRSSAAVGTRMKEWVSFAGYAFGFGARLRVAADLGRGLCRGRGHLARPRPPLRARDLQPLGRAIPPERAWNNITEPRSSASRRTARPSSPATARSASATR